MPETPLAYFISFTTYGNWLHGRDPGSVDRAHNQVGEAYLPPNPTRELEERQQLKESPYVLDAERRSLVLDAIREVACHRRWTLWGAHVRSNHVHIVVTADAKPEKVMIDFKAYASRRLKERLKEPADRTRWTQHGSTRYVWKEEQLQDVIDYVVNRQGTPMAVYDARHSLSEPEA